MLNWFYRIFPQKYYNWIAVLKNPFKERGMCFRWPIKFEVIKNDMEKLIPPGLRKRVTIVFRQDKRAIAWYYGPHGDGIPFYSFAKVIKKLDNICLI